MCKGVATMNNYVIKNIDKLNSSPYARSFYKKIGFIDTDTEQVKNGIRYTPMELNIGD
jgi:predicted GNAT family N-acyltransferase